MKPVHIIESKAGTYYVKERTVPKGCQYCLKGEKTVLFLNGLCQNPKHCFWYCPISEDRKGKNLTFANEINITSKEGLMEEIEKTKAKGMSITGGEPLLESNVEKTIEFIEFVKRRKGKKFHIHLYTNGYNFSEEIALRLARAGLDEIRFNPPKEKWEVIKYALHKGISVGAELPLIPEKDYIEELEEFVLYLDKIGVQFINLNEFEYCFPNSKYLKQRNFRLKEGTVASVENSIEMGLDFIKKIASKVSINIHFCSIIAKDYWQLKERYLRRAKAIKEAYEDISDEGLLLYAQIEGNSQILSELVRKMLYKLKIPKNLISFKGNLIKFPIKVALKKRFTKLLEKLPLKTYILETTPFKEDKYRQITEKIPIEVFKKEIGIYED